MKYKELEQYIEENNLLEGIEHGPGVYAITIDGMPVYIGQSKDVWQRLSSHIYGIENAVLSQEPKYLLLLAAKLGGHYLGFEVLGYYYEKDLLLKENKWMEFYKPCLNIRTPYGTQDINELRIEHVLQDVERLQKEYDEWEKTQEEVA